MYQQERMIAILDYLKEHKRITVDEICERYHVSRDTARRDLVKLEEQGAITRTRGGALYAELDDRMRSYQDRLLVVSEEKRSIGAAAAALIKDGENIILDTSTTVQACSEKLAAKNITAVTNSINQVDVLSYKEGVETYLLGGRLNKQHRFLYGTSVLDKLAEYHADKVFIGVGGITGENLAIAFEEEGEIKKKMMKCADQVIVLADHTKFGRPYFYRFADLAQVDVLITDRMPDESYVKLFEEYEIQLIVTDDTRKDEE